MTVKGVNRQKPDGTKPEPPPAPPVKHGDLIEIFLTDESGKRDVEQEFHSRIEALERRVEFLERANQDMALQFASLHQFAWELAKHVGLKPAEGPEEPEAF